MQNRTETIERFFGMAFVGLGALLVALLQAELHHFMPDGHTHEHAETTASDA
ncbi:MAG TPA: hypothetical protein PK765_00535 [bacterium]|nr:hypothetical protein [bacterium]